MLMFAHCQPNIGCEETHENIINAEYGEINELHHVVCGFSGIVEKILAERVGSKKKHAGDLHKYFDASASGFCGVAMRIPPVQIRHMKMPHNSMQMWNMALIVIITLRHCLRRKLAYRFACHDASKWGSVTPK